MVMPKKKNISALRSCQHDHTHKIFFLLIATKSASPWSQQQQKMFSFEYFYIY